MVLATIFFVTIRAKETNIIKYCYIVQHQNTQIHYRVDGGISILQCIFNALFHVSTWGYIYKGRPKGGRRNYISILLGMRTDALASANTIRTFLPVSQLKGGCRHPLLMENLLDRGPPGNPFSFGKYLREKLKFDSARRTMDCILYARTWYLRRKMKFRLNLAALCRFTIYKVLLCSCKLFSLNILPAILCRYTSFLSLEADSGYDT